MTLSQGPHEWSSAHRPINFTYTYQNQTIASISNDGGYAKVVVSSAYTTTPIVGDRLILSSTTSAAYDGVFKILTVNSTVSFTIDTPYTIPSALTGNCKFLKIPVFKIYTGYDTGEGYEDELPLYLAGTITPKNSPDNNIQLDVSGYLKSTFTIEEPSTTTGVDFAVWNRYRIYVDGAYSADYYVINSSIDSDILNKYYVKTGRFLVAYDQFTTGTPELRQYVQDCGYTLMYRIQGNAVVRYVFTDGVTGVEEHDGDFDTDFD